MAPPPSTWDQSALPSPRRTRPHTQMGKNKFWWGPLMTFSSVLIIHIYNISMYFLCLLKCHIWCVYMYAMILLPHMKIACFVGSYLYILLIQLYASASSGLLRETQCNVRAWTMNWLGMLLLMPENCIVFIRAVRHWLQHTFWFLLMLSLPTRIVHRQMQSHIPILNILTYTFRSLSDHNWYSGM